MKWVNPKSEKRGWELSNSMAIISAHDVTYTLEEARFECVSALEHEWDDSDGCHPPPLPDVICHMDLQTGGRTVEKLLDKSENANNVGCRSH